MDKSCLNYKKSREVIYNNEKYYRYNGQNNYVFKGEKTSVGCVHYGYSWSEKAYILDSDIDENIIFITDSSWRNEFWIKEGCKVPNMDDTPIQEIAIFFEKLDLETDIKASFEVDNLICDDLGKVAYYDYDAINYTNSRMHYNLYFNLGNGIFIRTSLAKGDDGIYYFLKKK